jgi:Polysaccharide pyruvyl transferase
MLKTNQIQPTQFDNLDITLSRKHTAQVALYSGWGVDPTYPNVGDQMCCEALEELLELNDIASYTTPRNSRNPIVEQWTGPLIVGGGTVIPGVFKNTIGPGLRHASKILLLGSGCLSPPEMAARELSIEGYKHFLRSEVLGLRGPLSCQYFQYYFRKKVDFVGDLAFMSTRGKVISTDSSQVTLFLIEHPMKGSRLSGNASQILSIFRGIVNETYKSDFYSAICLTDSVPPITSVTKALSWIELQEQAIIPKHLKEVIQRSRFIVTERLHPAICAACFGRPFIYLQTTSKSKDLELLMRHFGKKTDIKDCFVDLTKGQFADQKRIKRILENDQLPYQLLEISSKIKNKLIQAASKLPELLR